jgi:hypothetical protein
MPETLTGVNTFSNQIDVPKDNLNEPRSAASLQPAFQAILDNTKNLDVRVAALLASLNNLVVLNEDDDTAILSAVQAINDHVNDVTEAHALSSISYAGNVAAGLPASNAEVALDAIADRVQALETITPGLRYYEGYIGKNFLNSRDVYVGADVGASRNLFWYPLVIPAGKALKINRVLASKVGNSDRTTELQILCANSRVIGGGSTSGATNTNFTKSSVTNGPKDIDDSPNHTVFNNSTANNILVDFICSIVVIPTGGGGTIGDNNPQGFVEVTTTLE